MHDEQVLFVKEMRAKFPIKIIDKRVLDAGSLDVNGNVREIFQHASEYIGLDIGHGRNVDVVSLIHEYFPEKPFDVVLSLEALEHDIHWVESLKAITERLLVEGGLFIMTCAGEGRREHGTAEHDPACSPFTASSENKKWQSYYCNLTEEMIRYAIDINKCFEKYEFSSGRAGEDLYFWGIKRRAAKTSRTSAKGQGAAKDVTAED